MARPLGAAPGAVDIWTDRAVSGIVIRVDPMEVPRGGKFVRSVLPAILTAAVFAVELIVIAVLGPRLLGNAFAYVASTVFWLIGPLILVVIGLSMMAGPRSGSAKTAFDFLIDLGIYRLFRQALRWLFPVRFVHRKIRDAVGEGARTVPVRMCVLQRQPPSGRAPGSAPRGTGLLTAREADRSMDPATGQPPPRTPGSDGPQQISIRLRGHPRGAMVWQGQHVTFNGRLDRRSGVFDATDGVDSASGNLLKFSQP